MLCIGGGSDNDGSHSAAFGYGHKEEKKNRAHIEDVRIENLPYIPMFISNNNVCLPMSI